MNTERMFVRVLTGAALIIGASAGQTFAQADADGGATVDGIVATYLAAIGGPEARQKYTTRKTEGTLTLGHAGAMPWKMTTIQKAPDLKYAKVEIPQFGVVEEGHDGEVAWKTEPGKPPQEIRGQELKQKRRDAAYYNYVELKSQYKALTYAGQKDLKGTAHDVLEGTYEDGAKETLLLNAETHLLSLVKRPDVTIEVGDYRTVDGIQMAHSIVVLHREKTIFKITIDNVTHGVEVDDSLFAMPHGPDRGRRDGNAFKEGSTRVYVQTRVDAFDTNGNLTVEEKELEEGFLAMLERHSETHTMLLKLYDEDKDGALNEKESLAARAFVFSAMAVLQYDRDRNWKLDDPEADKGWERLADACQRHNDGVLKRFDKNHDGELSPREAQAGRR